MRGFCLPIFVGQKGYDGMHLLTLDSLSVADMADLFAQARHFKRTRATTANLKHPLAGMTIALLFEKPSLRTRVSFEVAIRELGGDPLYLSPQEVGLGTRESVADVARVLSSYVHGVVLRTFSHSTLTEFAANASVPVINGLTDAHHPCQGLTDIFTLLEACAQSVPLTLAYVGDGNNCAHSLIQAAMKAGVNMHIATPLGYEPDPTVIARAQFDAQSTGATLALFNDPIAAVTDVHAIYTDVWTSMGQEAEASKRQAIFAPYRVDNALLSHARSDAIVLHPLPAHRGEEITCEVLDGPQSRVFVQAENRLHLQKAILRTLMVMKSRVALTA